MKKFIKQCFFHKNALYGSKRIDTNIIYPKIKKILIIVIIKWYDDKIHYHSSSTLFCNGVPVISSLFLVLNSCKKRGP